MLDVQEQSKQPQPRGLNQTYTTTAVNHLDLTQFKEEDWSFKADEEIHPVVLLIEATHRKWHWYLKRQYTHESINSRREQQREKDHNANHVREHCQGRREQRRLESVQTKDLGT